ncbi:hypothetical protein GCM10010994_28670 [Chelatococcus reniformis]|uniref:HTH cro/C1-type domain-containing protein n=1 Tax=Chelatococcus reniformis TaxID=1494448 RepID=A0A916XEY8_9HYPH|nr:hypothetical protein GCM10010994_28670 [Chelatococcus reniformis]
MSARVQARLEALGINPFEAARRGGLQRNFVNDILIGRKRSLRSATMPALARALETTPAYLNGESDEPEISGDNDTTLVRSRMVPIVIAGKVEAGAFWEVDEFDQSEREIIFDVPDPDFPQARIVAFNVAGDSMNDLKPTPIMPGTRIVGIDYGDLAGRLPLRTGMVVVVQRTREGGHLREWSVKQVELREGSMAFWPRSTNPRHKPIIVDRNLLADDGQTVEVLAIVRRITSEVPI